MIKTEEKPVDIYILGAGASKAEFSQMPLMNDFFAVLAKCATFKEDDLWRCLTLLDCLRLFKNRHYECENLSAQIWLLRRQKSQAQLLRKKVREYISVFKDRMADVTLTENLEEVFERAVVAPVFYEQSPRHRLLAAINRLFEIIIEKKGVSFPVSSNFVKKVLKKKNRRPIFISFNYDLILDKTLTCLSNWNPKSGYGYKFRDIYNINSKKRTIALHCDERKDILLLKPHGSLSWRYEINLGHDSLRSHLTVDGKGAPAQEKYYFKHEKKYWKRFSILVVPPISAKSFSHPVLYETRNLVKKYLQQASTVTIIGWSLPETDIDMKNMVQRIYDDLESRSEQLEKLTIVDKGKKKEHFLRLQALFMAKRNVKFNNGFEKWV